MARNRKRESDGGVVGEENFAAEGEYYCTADGCSERFRRSDYEHPETALKEAWDHVLGEHQTEKAEVRFDPDLDEDDYEPVEDDHEVLPDGGEVQACSECGSAHIERLTRGFRHDHGHPKWRCKDCGARFDDPDTRAPRHPGGGLKHGPARDLADADPDEVLPDGGQVLEQDVDECPPDHLEEFRREHITEETTLVIYRCPDCGDREHEFVRNDAVDAGGAR